MLTQILTPPLEATHDKDLIHYPDTDGEPMAETDFQYKYLVYCRDSLDFHFQADPQVYVSGNLLIYYEKGNPRKSISPDVFVTFGIPKHDRPIYKVWEEGKMADVVIEITSKTTEKKDRIFKSSLYSRLGVKEYFLYDPTGDYLDPALQGFWLDEDGSYQEIGANQEAEVLKLESYLLKLELHLEHGRLRLYNPDTQIYLKTYSEEKTARFEAEMVAKSAAERAETETQARLEAEMVAKSAIERAEVETQARLEADARAEAETQARLEANARAEAEATRAIALEARLRELEAKLAGQ